MIVLQAPVPPPTIAALQSVLHAWSAVPSAAPRLARPLFQPGGAPAVGAGMEIFCLTPDAVLGSAPLAAAKPMGWRFTVSDDQNAAIWVDVTTGSTESSPVVSAVNRSPFHAVFQTALASTAGPARVGEPSHTTTMLEIPSLYVIALWSRSEGGSDVLTPLASASALLKPGVAMTADDFISGVQAIARARQGERSRPGVALCP